MNLKTVSSLFKEAFSEWVEDKAPLLSAALAYYTLFSIAPLMIIAVAIAGRFFGQEAARGEIVGAIQGIVGESGAHVIQTMIESARSPGSGVFATIVGIGILFYTASNLFNYLKVVLNMVWNVSSAPKRGIKGLLKDRFLSILMVLGMGFLLIVSLAASVGISALGTFLERSNQSGSILIWQAIDLIISFCVIMVIFAVMYKILPDAKIVWGDAWVGATVTSSFFMVGEVLIGFYLGRSGIWSIYGAAGSFFVVLLWMYYSAQIFLFGAEFTHVYANNCWSRVVPNNSTLSSTRVTNEMRKHKK